MAWSNPDSRAGLRRRHAGAGGRGRAAGPPGAPGSERQRRVGAVAAGLLWIAGALVLTVRAIAGHHTQVDPSGNLLLLTGNDPAAGWWNLVEGMFFPLLGACWLASLAGQVLSYRRSAGDRRQQLKWLMTGSALAFACVPLAVLSGSKALGAVFVLAGFFAMPLCIGVAILRYRLFDIDRIVSRTLACNRPTCRCGSAVVINDHKSGLDNLCWPTISADFRGASCRHTQRTSANLVAAVR